MSPVSVSWRRRLELLCRVGAIVCLCVASLAVWSTSRASVLPVAPSVFTIATPDTMRALRDLVVRRETRDRDSLLLRMSSLPSPMVRAALGTLHRSFTTGVLIWDDRSAMRGAALSVEAEGGPQGGVQLRLAIPDSSGVLVLRDTAGVLDSTGVVTSRADRVQQWQLASVGRHVAVRLSGATLSAPTEDPDADSSRRVLVVAMPGWESKFVIAALEEHGWRVDARLPVTPRAAVAVGTPASLSATRYAAVVVLDSIDVPQALSAYLREGGGVVISGDGVRSAVARSLLTIRGATRRPAVPGALLTEAPLDGLERWQFQVRDAVPLVRTVDDAPVVARRFGAGRVIASGYRNTWQWRMMGSDAGRIDHARWWSALVQSAQSGNVAQRGAVDPSPGEVAPFADLVASLGRPASAAGSAVLQAPPPTRASRAWAVPVSWLPWLVGVALGALLIEWASRRLRGAP